MNLVEVINARYVQAIEELKRLANQPPQNARERYDYKKALERNKGRPPKRQTLWIDKMMHELSVERTMHLKGLLDGLDRLESMDLPYGTMELIKQEFGDIEYALKNEPEALKTYKNKET